MPTTFKCRRTDLDHGRMAAPMVMEHFDIVEQLHRDAGKAYRGADCGLFLEGHIDPFVLRLGERHCHRARPQVREEFRVVPLAFLNVVDRGN